MKMLFEKTFIVLMTAFVILGTASCEKDNDLDPPPNVDPREKFLGTWNVADNLLKAGGSSYKVTISEDPSNSAYVIIDNFANLKTEMKGIATAKKLTLISDDHVKDAIGTFKSEFELYFTFKLLIAGDSESREASFRK